MFEGVIGADLEASWIGGLRERAPDPGPMKWDHVKEFVLSGTGGAADAVREGLGGQALIVTDPMRHARSVDLSMATAGLHATPLADLIFLDCRPTREVDRRAMVGLRQISDRARAYIFDEVVRASGLGRIAGYLADSQRSAVEYGYASGPASRSGLIAPVTASLKGGLNKVVKLASKATALALPVTDPDHAGHTRVYERLSSYVEVYRYGLPADKVAQASLSIIAERRMVVDGGHDDIVKLTGQIRDMAEVFAEGPYFDRARAFGDLAERRSTDAASRRGFVRSGDDVRELRLQVADVLAGFGREIVARHGYGELHRRVRKVIYNGQALTAELAATLDREKHDHARLMARSIG